MKAKALKNRIAFFAILSLSAAFFVQSSFLPVKANILPLLVSFTNLDFGASFPGEIRENFFDVFFNTEEEGLDGVHYRLTLNEVNATSTLCTFLDLSSTESEGDTADSALVSDADTSDSWKVLLKTPAIEGHVGDGHTFGTVANSGLYLCDIGVDVIEVIGGPGSEGGPQTTLNGDNGGTGGGGGGVGLIDASPLQIFFGIRVTEVGEDYFVVEWETNKKSTSRVVYDTASHPTVSLPPNYGYAFSTPTSDIDPKVTEHRVRVENLTPGETYYYRVISAASPDVWGHELSVTLLKRGSTGGPSSSAPEEFGVGGAFEDQGKTIGSSVTPPSQRGIAQNGATTPKEDNALSPLEEERKEMILDDEEDEEDKSTASLNGIGAFLGGLRELDRFEWLLLFLFIIFLIWLISRWRKFKEEEKKRTQRKK